METHPGGNAKVIPHPKKIGMELAVNTSLFKRGGVMSRLQYFIAGLKVTGIMIAATAIPGVLAHFKGANADGSPNMPVLIACGLIGFLGLLPCFYAGFINAFKRLRDIRGSTDSQLGWQIGLVVGMCIPYFQVLPGLALLFWPGKVTPIQPIHSSPPQHLRAA